MVAMATSTGESQNNFRSFIYGQSSIKPANFVKIGPVDVAIIGLTEITKIFDQQQKNISPPRRSFAKSGGGLTSAKHKPTFGFFEAGWAKQGLSLIYVLLTPQNAYRYFLPRS